MVSVMTPKSQLRLHQHDHAIERLMAGRAVRICRATRPSGFRQRPSELGVEVRRCPGGLEPLGGPPFTQPPGMDGFRPVVHPAWNHRGRRRWILWRPSLFIPREWVSGSRVIFVVCSGHCLLVVFGSRPLGHVCNGWESARWQLRLRKLRSSCMTLLQPQSWPAWILAIDSIPSPHRPPRPHLLTRPQILGPLT